MTCRQIRKVACWRHALITLLALSATLSSAEEEGTNLFALNLEELMQVKVSTASVRATDLSRQSATLTVLSRADIERTGATDLLEALEYVPGISTGVDVFGVVSLVVRGQWAHEGKVLFVIDGIPVNDRLYGALNMARHYPTELIERIEVIRGAGTAKYGGNAQLAVIKIITRSFSKYGHGASLYAEQQADVDSGWQSTFRTGISGTDYAATLNAAVRDLPWTNTTWNDTDNAAYPLGDATGYEESDLSLNGNWRNWRAQLWWDEHLSQTPQRFGYARFGETVSFETTAWQIEGDIALAEGWLLTPRLRGSQQDSWFIERDPSKLPQPDFKLPTESLTGELTLQYDKGGEWSSLAGLTYTDERAHAISGGAQAPAEVYFAGADSARYFSQSAWAQFDWERDRLNLSFGGRYSNHSYAGNSFVPRLGAVWQGDGWYLKAHYGQAFREPNIEVINASDFAAATIQPETTSQSELEWGLTGTARMQTSIALFQMKIDDPIIYSTSTDTSEYWYRNNSPLITQGMEWDWRFTGDRFSATTTVSYYRTVDNEISLYRVAADPAQTVGNANWMATVVAEYRLSERLHLMASAKWLDKRYAYDFDAGALDEDGDTLSLQQLDAQTIVNLSMRYRHEPWQLTVGVNNASDETRLYAQPYSNASTPWPGPARTVFVNWQISWR